MENRQGLGTYRELPLPLSQLKCSLFATGCAPAKTRGCGASGEESSTGTASRALLAGFDRRPILRPPGAGSDRLRCRADYEVVDTFKETGSGIKLERVERHKVMALAQARHIDAVLVTELSRWGAARRAFWRR
jgi:hypothetical protein